MSFRKEIEQYLEQIQVLEESFRQMRDMEILPLSFFSSSYDILKQLTAGLQAIESSQLAEEQSGVAGKETVSGGFLSDKISKKLFADFKQSLSLNDRFRFQRDLFGGDVNTMNDTLEKLNTKQSFNEALYFLNEQFAWNWEHESVLAFRDLLEKRFT